MKLTWRAPANLFLAICRVVRANFRREIVFLEPEQVKERLDVCEGVPGTSEPCEFFAESDRQCLACECFVDFKAHASTEKCPKRRWPKALTRKSR